MLEMLLSSKAGAALGSGLGQGIGAALGGGPAGPSNAQSGAYGTSQDGSGWSVNFSGTQTTTAQQDKSGGVPGIGVSGVGSVLGVPWYVWAILGGAVLWKLKKSK